ncbi:unnamed protein product [Lymnaea stagnalis]|uniref:RanBP2-type domain-containing protein n=1 Tax=Lymnaea stagnalis TaxID=6523 RepID=A0AAV2I7B1_LYMST
MADTELLNFLKYHYPNVPITAVIKVMRRFGNDKDKCIKALEEDKKNYPNSDIPMNTPVQETLSNNNIPSPGEGKSISARIQELQVSHESAIQSKGAERHVSTIERSVINPSRNQDLKRPVVTQSVLVTVQTGDRSSSTTSGTAAAQGNRVPGGNMITPQTAPADFTPFMFSRSPTDVPNIECRAAARPRQPTMNSSATSSPVEQRRPVKVINIPPGSLSGGSVSPAATPPNSRHIRMHFGDTGGICTVSAPPSNMHRYGSTPNVSQHFRTELRTEATSSQPVHSSSIVVNTTSHVNNLTPDRKANSGSNKDSPHGDGRRTPVPPLNLNTSDFQASSGTNNPHSAVRPLSTPVQATSPGTAHSRPMFVEIRRDQVSSGPFFSPATVRAPPTFIPHQTSYNSSGNNYIPYNSDFPNHSQQEHYQNAQYKRAGYSSPPTSIYQSSSNSTYSPYPQYNISSFPVIGVSGPAGQLPGQPPSHLSQYTHYTPPQGLTGIHHLPKSPSVGVAQPLMNSRSNSQDSEHSVGAEYDGRSHHYNNMGSRVSSHSSISSDSSVNRLDRGDKGTRPRSGSIQDEAGYIQALLQHQKSRMKKLEEDTEQYKVILERLRAEVGDMEKNMIENSSHASRSFPSVEDISRLCESNRLLQTDIQMYMNEIDMYKSGQTPFNKINPLDQQNFFANMPTGQHDPIYGRIPASGRLDDNRRPLPVPPPRPPPPIPIRQPSAEINQAIGGNHSNDIFRVPPVPSNYQPAVNSGDSEEGDSWNCSYCTFSNHPALKKCEVCEMPRNEMIPGPPLPPHQPVIGHLPPRLVQDVVGNVQARSGSPSSTLGHHHRAGT